MKYRIKMPHLSFKQRGITITEFTIVLPIFLILMFSIIQGGVVIFMYNQVSHAAKEGVRYAVVRGTEAGADPARVGDAPATSQTVSTYVKSKASLDNLTVTTSWPVSKEPGQAVTVQVSYPLASDFIFFPTFNITASSTGIIHY